MLENDGDLSQIELEIKKNYVIYNGQRIVYSKFVEEIVLETFFLLIMDYAEELSFLSRERTLKDVFDEAFTLSFMEISRQYEVPVLLAESFSTALLSEKYRKNNQYKKFLSDIKNSTMNLIYSVSLN